MEVDLGEYVEEVGKEMKSLSVRLQYLDGQAAMNLEREGEEGRRGRTSRSGQF